jgi:peptidyl-prolyl cis-trans isomerase-like 6
MGASGHTAALDASTMKETWSEIAETAYTGMMEVTGNGYVYFEVSVNGEPIGRLVFELFRGLAPKTCDNFEALCTGSKGKHKSGVRLHYLDTPIHRIKADGWIQAGDIVSGNGEGGICAVGKSLPDESFAMSHDRSGILGMANTGRHSATSQFYVTLGPNLSFDRTYVAFGRLIDGSAVLDTIGGLATIADRPQARCACPPLHVIRRCPATTPSMHRSGRSSVGVC